MAMQTRLVLLAAALAFAGCKIGPDHHAPAGALPDHFAHTDAVATTNHAPAGLAEWWSVFNDARLSTLMRTAMSSNLDVRIAQARVLEARAQRGLSRSALWPQVNANGGYSRSRLSENTLNGQQILQAGKPLENDLFDAGFDMSWEIDVFGGARRAVEAAQAELESSAESGRDTLVTVLAETGFSYLDLRGAQRQLAVARENLKAQEQTLALTKDRFQAGLASELDTARSQAQVAATRAQIPPLEQAQQRAMHRLAVLLGKTPGELDAELVKEAAIPTATPRVPVGLPSDLLLRRPDLRRAERQLASATARIGVAKGEWFPKFYLTGAAGLQSIDTGDFFDGGSRFWSIGPSLRWPIFSAGRIRQNVKIQTARQEQALLQYEKSVLTALEEVENALVAFGREQERLRSLGESEQASRRSVALATDRYRGGLVSFLDVLEAERSLLAVQDGVVQSERQLGQNLIRLYKALGGGWMPESSSYVSAVK